MLAYINIYIYKITLIILSFLIYMFNITSPYASEFSLQWINVSSRSNIIVYLFLSANSGNSKKLFILVYFFIYWFDEKDNDWNDCIKCSRTKIYILSINVKLLIDFINKLI